MVCNIHTHIHTYVYRGRGRDEGLRSSPSLGREGSEGKNS
jgi:hypothetical protein